MNRLLEIGFEPAGHWLPKGDGIAFELSRHASQRNILYAFVSDGEVKYVGKTVQPLHARMGGYKNPAPSQTTNVRNNSRIKALLQSGAAVDILALPDNGLLHYGQFHINLAAGLEDNIISVLNPEWNRNPNIPVNNPTIQSAEPPVPLTEQHDTGREEDQGAAKSAATAVPANEPSFQAQKPIASFPLVVHKTYFNQGFFNVGVSHADQFGNVGQEIEVFCGSADQPIIGTINRTANSNKTPRIMGGKGLRDWFHQEMSEMQEATIAVLSPTAIRIMPCKG